MAPVVKYVVAVLAAAFGKHFPRALVRNAIVVTIESSAPPWFQCALARCVNGVAHGPTLSFRYANFVCIEWYAYGLRHRAHDLPAMVWYDTKAKAWCASWVTFGGYSCTFDGMRPMKRAGDRPNEASMHQPHLVQCTWYSGDGWRMDRREIWDITTDGMPPDDWGFAPFIAWQQQQHKIH